MQQHLCQPPSSKPCCSSHFPQHLPILPSSLGAFSKMRYAFPSFLKFPQVPIGLRQLAQPASRVTTLLPLILTSLISRGGFVSSQTVFFPFFFLTSRILLHEKTTRKKKRIPKELEVNIEIQSYGVHPPARADEEGVRGRAGVQK